MAQPDAHPLSLAGNRWVFRDTNDAAHDALMGSLGIAPIVARLLTNRGFVEPTEVRGFLEPQLSQLHDPCLLPDIDKAVARIRQAVAKGERVLVYGDYDADGVTATALLLRFFRLMGLETSHYIPCRIGEGYGLNLDAVEKLSEKVNKERLHGPVDLIVTVDCGTSSDLEIELAGEYGVDVIVTDHHEPGQGVPRACAVVNPKLTGSLYPFRELAGVGVAFKLAWALAQSFSPGKRVTDEFREFLLDAMGLVAIGTVADVVPLIGENRVFATYGLQALRESTDPGIHALVEQAGITGRAIRPSDVAFKLGPRLNAAGRMAHADLCVDLFTSESLPDAEAIACELETNNRERQRVQADILRSVRDVLASDPKWHDRRSIVLAHEDWHPGVVGIVASRIAEEWHRPVILLGIRDGVARGSARSVPGFDLYEAVEACGELLMAFGGHAGAAGMSLLAERVDAFSEQFEAEVAARIRGIESTGLLDVDTEVPLAALDRNLVRELDRMAPFGKGNPAPVLACSGVTVAGQPRVLGHHGQHLAFYARQGDLSLRVVGFGMGRHYESIVGGNVVCDIAFQPKINDFRGLEEVELELQDLRLCP